MSGLEDVPPENLEAIAEQCRTARLRMSKNQSEVANEVGISPGMVSLIERSGPYPGMRAFDFLKLVEYYKLNIGHIASLLGIQLYDVNSTQETPFAAQSRIIDGLPAEQREWLTGVIDALLRGMR